MFDLRRAYAEQLEQGYLKTGYMQGFEAGYAKAKEDSENEYKAKVKELENAIAKCEKAEEEFKSRTCKFRSPTNCDFCSFHSDCVEHWKEGE